MVPIAQLKLDIKALQTKARTLKTKPAKEKFYTKIRDLRGPALELHSGKIYGAHRGKNGLTTFQAWDRKRDAQAMIDLIQSGNVIEKTRGES